MEEKKSSKEIGGVNRRQKMGNRYASLCGRNVPGRWETLIWKKSPRYELEFRSQIIKEPADQSIIKSLASSMCKMGSHFKV